MRSVERPKIPQPHERLAPPRPVNPSTVVVAASAVIVAQLHSATIRRFFRSETLHSPRSSTRRAMMTGLLVMSCIASNAYADDVSDANETISTFKKTDPGLARFFNSSVGYAVFPTVTKGGLGVGAAHGSGVLYE